jgi:3',5'-cyclic AMP phosphodiesterase CpdA
VEELSLGLTDSGRRGQNTCAAIAAGGLVHEANDATMSSTSAVHLVHFSDIHVTAEHLGWKRADWLNKRGPGWLNLKGLGREYRFRDADRVVTALADEIRQRRPDHVIFSGDATALGFEEELTRAIALLGAAGPGSLPGMAVPGNHDYYTRSVAESGLFERYFAAWQKGERVDGATYPFAQRVGHVWLVGVNSAAGNRWFWDATGRVGHEQLARLATLLERLSPGPRILVTHYPVCRDSGARERRWHRLRDLSDLMAVAVRGGVCLWLHGHRHGAYCHGDCDLVPFPVVCVGSATQSGLWTYGEYTIQGEHFHGLRRVYCPEENAFRDGETFDFDLCSYRTSSVNSG